MDKDYMLKTISECSQTCSALYEALDTLQLTGYAQQKTNINCMEGIKIMFNRLDCLSKHIREEFDEIDSTEN